MKKTILEVIEELTGQQAVQYSNELKAIKCPFHDDQKPSLVIYEHSSSYFCFPCSFGGDVYNFYSKFKGCSFRQAKEALDGNVDTLVEIGEYLDGLNVKDEVDYNDQVNFAISKYVRDLLYRRPELETKIMEFLKKMDKDLTTKKISAILMAELIVESRKLEIN
jgi:DNA primase